MVARLRAPLNPRLPRYYELIYIPALTRASGCPSRFRSPLLSRFTLPPLTGRARGEEEEKERGREKGKKREEKKKFGGFRADRTTPDRFDGRNDPETKGCVRAPVTPRGDKRRRRNIYGRERYRDRVINHY